MILLKENIQLKNGIIGSIYQENYLQNFKGTPLVLRTYAELIEKGFNIGNILSINNETSIVWFESDKNILGGICYSVQEKISQVWINFSFTDPNYRNLGVNFHCHYALEEISRARNIKYIASHVSVSNTERIESCKKVGMMPRFYRMHKTL